MFHKEQLQRRLCAEFARQTQPYNTAIEYGVSGAKAVNDQET